MAVFDWLKNVGGRAINWIGTQCRNIVQGAKRVGNVIGQGINNIGNGVQGVWGKMKTIPIVGNDIGNSPICRAVYLGLGITKAVGNALQGEGSITDAGKQVISVL